MSGNRGKMKVDVGDVARLGLTMGDVNAVSFLSFDS